MRILRRIKVPSFSEVVGWAVTGAAAGAAAWEVWQWLSGV